MTRSEGHANYSVEQAIGRTYTREAEAIPTEGSFLSLYLQLPESLMQTPQRAIQTVAEYLDPLVSLANQRWGLQNGLHKINHLQIWFCSPLMDNTNHARRAVETAWEMRSLIEEMNRSRQSEDKPILTIGIGIESGQVIYGMFHGRDIAAIVAIGHPAEVSREIAFHALQLSTLNMPSPTPAEPIIYRPTLLIGQGANEAVREFANTAEVAGFTSIAHKPVVTYQVLGLRG